jgi:aryl-alcohol dehydrogenase-like predicted oxidoreductase
MSGTLPQVKDHIAMGVFDFFQTPYSVVKRKHEAIISTAADAGAAIVVLGGAAKGALSEGRQQGSHGSDGRQRNLMTCLVA